MIKIGVEEVTDFLSYLIVTLTFALLGWFISWWSFSFFWVGLFSVLYSWKVTFSKAKQLQTLKTKRFFQHEKETINEIFEEIPRWVYFPDIERVEWVNKVAVLIWPDVTHYITDFLKNTLEGKIQACLPEKLKSFTFEKIDLGDRPPRITGVKVYDENTHQDEIIMDLDIFYAGDVALSIKCTGFQAGVKDIQFKGTLRVVLKPLLRQPPFLGGIQIYFLTNPMLNFDLTDIASFFEVPGLYELLRKALLTQIANYLIIPNKISISFSKDVDVSQLRHVEPKGVLFVQLVEARDLAGCDLGSKSDPYAKISVSTEQFRSKVVKNSNNPVWEDQLFYFTVLETEGVNMELRLFDKDDTSGDDAIGTGDQLISVPVRSLVEQGYIDVWKDLSDKGGSVHFISSWYGLTSDLTEARVPDVHTHQSGDLQLPPTTVVSVYVDSAKNLRKVDSKEPSTKVMLKLGSSEKLSGDVLSTPNPQYQENFHFLLSSMELESLALEVCDVESDDVFGTVDIPLSRVIASPDHTLYEPHVLSGGSGLSELLVRITIKYLMNPLVHADNNNSETGSKDIMETLSSACRTDNDQSVGTDSSRRSSASARSLSSSDSTEIRRRRVHELSSSKLSKSEDRPRHASSSSTHKDREASVELTLSYKQPANKLTVVVHGCRELMKENQSEEEAPDSYIKLCIMPDEVGKCETEVCKDSFYPKFEQTFEFSVKPTDLGTKSLQVKVKRHEYILSNVEVGRLAIPLSSIDIGKPTTKWYTFQLKE